MSSADSGAESVSANEEFAVIVHGKIYRYSGPGETRFAAKSRGQLAGLHVGDHLRFSFTVTADKANVSSLVELLR